MPQLLVPLPTSSRFPGVLLLPMLLLAGPLLPVESAGAGAQEIRGGMSGAFSGGASLASSVGSGVGIRILPWNQLGFGVELDRWGFSPTLQAPVCDEAGEECTPERVAMDNRLETLTFLLLGELVRTEDWRFRVGFGRVAGTVRGTAVSQDSGTELDPPAADRGGGRIAWSRGADGTVLVFEILRRIPVPGPLTPSLLAAYRYHALELEGCVPGAWSPFCGPTALSELQLGLHLPLWPR